MKLPNLSFMVRVGQLRAIQARYEAEPNRNPDTAASALLPLAQRVGCVLRGRLFLNRTRAQPFYAFVLARTKYYDSVFNSAIAQGVRHIVNIGCGGDTRAHRFQSQRRQMSVGVVECDQPQAIGAKRRLVAKQLGPQERVDYLAIDLNDDDWPALRAWFAQHANDKLLIMLEGVSPYVAQASFDGFLRFVVAQTKPGSMLAYDFKHQQAAAAFGVSARAQQPFRLPAQAQATAHYHAGLGLQQLNFESSADLCRRLAPGLLRPSQKPFDEDCLVLLSTVAQPAP
jgi:methyltransferase (TIGR00027 family)